MAYNQELMRVETITGKIKKVHKGRRPREQEGSDGGSDGGGSSGGVLYGGGSRIFGLVWMFLGKRRVAVHVRVQNSKSRVLKEGRYYGCVRRLQLSAARI